MSAIAVETSRPFPTCSGMSRVVAIPSPPYCKTDFGKFIYGYECDTRLADAEFLLTKRQYANLTGRNQGSDDVIAYHLRQAFKPGEVAPEEANQIGRELALKLTKGNHAFVVCTHVDKHHVHNHIIINSTTLVCQKKFRNFLGSSWAIRRMNDKLCSRVDDDVIMDMVLIYMSANNKGMV